MKQLNVGKDVLESFFGKKTVSYKPYGSGHIHDTYLVEVEKEDRKYVLQKINSYVFPNVQAVMDNIIKVTNFIREKLIKKGKDPNRQVLTIKNTLENKPYFIDSMGETWRVYLFIKDVVTYQLPENNQQFYEAAKAFGEFQILLDDYPTNNLTETIKDFHNTPIRVLQLKKALKSAPKDRLTKAKAAISFAKERFEKADILTKDLQNKELPLRVTHNDTKMNNVLMDKNSSKGICVIDLDTVMPGLTAYDFGDAIRFGANTAEEGEKDISRTSLDLGMFEAYAKGFLEKTAKILTEKEADSLSLGAIVISYETGLRFLADYLKEDVYFKISYPEENLIRANNQFALVKDMEGKIDSMKAIVKKYYQAYREVKA